MNTVFPRLCAHALISALPRISAYPLLDLDCSSSLIAFETKLQFFPLLTRRFQSFQRVFYFCAFPFSSVLCSDVRHRVFSRFVMCLLLRRLIGFSLKVGARASVLFFQKIFMFSLFQVTNIKGRRARFTVWKSRSCYTRELRSRRHVTLKSPFLLQFPYCKLCDNADKQSNHRIMIVLFYTKAIFADFSNSPK